MPMIRSAREGDHISSQISEGKPLEYLAGMEPDHAAALCNWSFRAADRATAHGCIRSKSRKCSTGQAKQ